MKTDKVSKSFFIDTLLRDNKSVNESKDIPTMKSAFTDTVTSTPGRIKFKFHFLEYFFAVLILIDNIFAVTINCRKAQTSKVKVVFDATFILNS